jgi:hypothetical protein
LLEFFGAELGRIVFLDRSGDQHDLHRVGDPRAVGFEPVSIPVCGAYIRQENPALPDNVLVASFPRDSRIHGMLLVERAEAFPHRLREPFRKGVSILRTECELRERQRLAALQERLSRKLLRKLSPKDFFYQLFHGLRSLIRYDHSAALLVAEDGGNSFRIVAEQIAWKKGKSEAVGETLKLPTDVCLHLLNTRRSILLEEDALEAGEVAHEGMLETLRRLGSVGADNAAPKARSLLVAPMASNMQLKVQCSASPPPANTTSCLFS